MSDGFIGNGDAVGQRTTFQDTLIKGSVGTAYLMISFHSWTSPRVSDLFRAGPCLVHL